MDGKDIRRWIRWGLVTLLCLLVLGVGIFWALEAAGIVTMNIRREVVQHSQQYTETKVNLLNKLYNDWTQLESEMAELKNVAGNGEILAAKFAQQKAIVVRIKTEAKLIPTSEVPEDIRQFISEN